MSTHLCFENGFGFSLAALGGVRICSHHDNVWCEEAIVNENVEHVFCGDRCMFSNDSMCPRAIENR